MIEYNSRIAFESKLFEGVTVLLRKMSEGRKAQLRRSLAEFNQKYREFQQELIELDERRTPVKDKATGEIQVNKDSGDPLTEFTSTADRMRYLNILSDMDSLEANEAKPLYIRWAVEKIDGLTIDGAPATAETLLSDGPPELVDEVLDEVKRLSGLSAAERKNSAQPTTSSPAEPIETSDTAVDPANETISIKAETA